MSPTFSHALSAAQLQLWAGQQLRPESPMYVMALVVRIEGIVDADRFSDAWQSLQERHPSISARIEQDNGEFQQVSMPAVALEHVDLSAEVDPLKTCDATLKRRTAEPFVLDDVLTESSLIRLGETSWAWYIKQHHVLTDAASFATLWQQLIELYTGEQTRSKEASSRTFADYAAACASEPMDHGAAAHWASFQDVADLRLFAALRSEQTTTTLSQRLPLAMDDARRTTLTELCERPSARALSVDISRATVLLTLFSAYLARISGSSTITVGVPTANRSDARDQHTPGLFIEVLPLTLEVNAEASFDELALHVRTALMKHLMFARPATIDQVTSTHIQAIFNYINVSLVAVDGWTIDPEWLHSGHADHQHALRLQVTDWLGEGQQQLDLDLNASVYADGRKEHVSAHWWALFNAMAADGSCRIGDVDLLDDTEPRQYGTVPNDHQPGLLLLESLAQSVSSDGARLALSMRPQERESDGVADNFVSKRSPGESVASGHSQQTASQNRMTYGELAALSDAVARELINRGLTPGSRVALHQSRSIEVVVCMIAIMKCSAVWVPIEAATPSDRAANLLADSDATMLITDRTNNEVSAPGCTVMKLDELFSATDDSATQTLPVVNAHTTAYILYTSGSTGKAKGVVVSHGALANYLNRAKERYAGGDPLSFPLFTPLGFDLTITSLFLPLVTGGQVYVYPETTGGADTTVFDVFEDDVVDVVKLTPSHLSLLQDRAVPPRCIRQLIVGGESFSTSLAARMHARFGGRVALHNEYGPTESAVGCVVHTYDVAADTQAAVPIGQPIDGVNLMILNEQKQAQPAGVEGELYIGGQSLADGYWQRDDLTDAAFVTLENSERFYRSGDRVVADTRGKLHYLGRLDDQVKIAGVRIETAEIEAACLTLPGISECVANVVTSPRDELESAEHHCLRCGLSSRSPEASMDNDGICALCRNYEQYEERAQAYFRSMSELEAIVDKARNTGGADYDCIMLLSGGKDSSYALSCLVDYGLRVLAFTLDNGYISEQAKANISRVCKALNVDHRYGETPAMNEIFADSLKRHSNVCNGCFKVLYTLSIDLALELNISTIFTGLSRGQFFETRLSEELFTMKRMDVQVIDKNVLSARRAYHLVDDAVSRCMDVSRVRDPATFDKVSIVDFYRYSSVSLEEMYAYLENRLPWVRPSDTGRSTNCLINDVGIHVHKVERGYHNYSLPYSWDVRLGHKVRDEALEELDDLIDENFVAEVLDQVGYEIDVPDSGGGDRLALYYVTGGKSAKDSSTSRNTGESPSLDETTYADAITPDAVRQHLESQLTSWMMPSFVVPLERLPLSENGKVSRADLPAPQLSRDNAASRFRMPSTSTERWLCRLWGELLRVDSVGVDDNYFELNGDSLTAIRLVARINREGLQCSVAELFANQTVAALAAVLDARQKDAGNTAGTLETLAAASSDSAVDNNSEKLSPTEKRFSAIDADQLKKLSNLLGNVNKH